MVIPRPRRTASAPWPAAASATSPRRRCAPRASNPSLGFVATLGLRRGAARPARHRAWPARRASLRRRRIAAAGAVALMRSWSGRSAAARRSSRSSSRRSCARGTGSRSSSRSPRCSRVALLLTALGDRLRARGRPAWVRSCVAAAVGVVGILDQTSPQRRPGLRAIAAAWKVPTSDFADADAGPLPGRDEGPSAALHELSRERLAARARRLRPVQGLPPHRAACAGPTARSAGARRTGWPARGTLPPEQLATAAAAAGFGAVYVDGAGYADDGGAAVAAALGHARRARRVACRPDGRLQFFDLRPAAARLAARRPPPSARRSPTRSCIRSCSASATASPTRRSTGDGLPFRWAGPDARLTLDNPLRGTRTVRFTRQVFGGGAGAVDGDAHAARRQPPDDHDDDAGTTRELRRCA